MRKIILDTNFLLIPGQFKIDIFSEIDRICDFNYKLCIIDKSLDELNKIIKEQKGKDKAAAKLALTILNQKRFNIIKTKNTDETVDDIIIGLVKKEKPIIATQDKELKQKIKSKTKVITLRKKKYLII